ncbi:Clan CA, family C19, ubiquitin hydrolase-like cysteine peptidase [Histomonas meleagridis]|uniref:Clan CA, family C19, ubiquitin hydrolase-like cysteine peptidase n=1 Tax=Histomonas meleagridis TaxID=135588 RepID=UPI0035595579|nr:Clan CA, family C19, ubiquitin hydrolase-like cysteine peptidase [Histomonas meleagridis]KAH0802364.1 Clan CA, family C19, ubiquitin hydrolase-like cysteine peptidase [Histomonas meleagridis]
MNSYSDDSSSEYDSEEYKEEEGVVPPLNVQLKIIQKIMKPKLNEKAYLLSEAWVSDVREIIGNNENKECPINNSDLTDSDGNIDFENKILNSDYYVISEQAWNKLLKWNGGGPELEINMIEVEGKPRPLIPLKVKVNYKEEEKEIITNKFENCGDFKKKVLSLFNLPQDTECRIIDYNNKYFSKVMKDKKMMRNYRIYPDQNIYLDVKGEDGEWVSNFKESEPITYSSPTIYSNNYYYTPTYSSPSYGAYSYSYYSTTQYGPAKAPGLVGLQNLTNTCFFNSGIQCLVHTNPLKKLFLHSDWEQDLNRTNPIGMKGKLAEAFISLFKEIWSGKKSVISPIELKRTIGEFTERFSGWGQQDSHELITFMLDGLSEDLNRRRVKESTENVVGDGTNDEEVSKLSWENFKKRCDSMIIDTFYGQLRSRLYCPNCNITTVIFEPYFSLSLPMAKPKPLTMDVTFIPYDFKEPRRELSIIIRTPLTFENISKAVSEQINREVKVVAGMKESYSSKITWKLEPSSSRYSYYSKPEYYVMEIPDETKFYVPVTLKMNFEEKSQYTSYTYDKEKELIFPTLIPVNSKDATEEEIADSATERLSSIWDEKSKEEVEVNEIMKEMIEHVKLPTEEFEDGRKIHATISSYYYDTDKSLTADKEYPYLSTRIVKLTLDSKSTNVESGFSLEALLRHIKPESSGKVEEDESEMTITLEKCFEYYTMNETLDEGNEWFCPHCRKHVCADKQLDIWSIPKCLIVHLKRFVQNGMYDTKKLDINVDYPMEIDMSQYVKGPKNDDKPLIYKLYAISEHMGSLEGGHYTAHAINVLDHHVHGKWYSFNDSHVSESSEEKAKDQKAEAYVLFYERVDPDEVSDDDDDQEEENENEISNNRENIDEDLYVGKIGDEEELNEIESNEKEVEETDEEKKIKEEDETDESKHKKEEDLEEERNRE